MSARDIKLKVSQLSKDFTKIIEREEDKEKRILLFENFYKTLNLIQDIYIHSHINNRKIKKRIT